MKTNMNQYLTLKDLKSIVAECQDYADDTPVLIATSIFEKAKGMPVDIDDLYNHQAIDSFYRLIPSDFIENGMPYHPTNGAIELIIKNI